MADITNSPQHWLEAALGSGTVLPPVTIATEVPAAITGGEAPTEAEHNALRSLVEEIHDALVDVGIIVQD
jgi:hypothetical protein